MPTMNMEGKQPSEEPLKKKVHIEECRKNSKPNEGAAETTEEDDNKVSVSSLDLPRRRRLPLEMECEIYKCLTLEIQTKFIWGMGRGIYGMFRHNLLTKSKRLGNQKGMCWNATKTKATISDDGLTAEHNNRILWHLVFAEQEFGISVEQCRMENFPGTVLYYFEVTHTTNSSSCYIGLSDGNMADSGRYARFCHLSGKTHRFKRPNGAIKPKRNSLGLGNVCGCGLILNPDNKLAIFFTYNGILMGKQIPINPSVDRLFPTVCIPRSTIEANFGHNSAKPFKYDIAKCPGLV